jgi:adenine deaminase
LVSDDRLGFDAAAWRRRIVVARGTGNADVLLAGGKIVNVFSGELEEANIAVAGGKIAGVGSYGRAASYIDCRGKIITPSFIDPHIHTESSLVWLPEFARAVVPRGTGAVVTDPHEIANVTGLPGLEAMRQAAVGLPLHFRFTAPSCVPASSWESPGATFGVNEIAEMLTWAETVGLGELMNVAGAISGDHQIGDRLRASFGHRLDGHAPGVTGRKLQVYANTGVTSDHESTELAEAEQKLRSGLMIMIRQGTSARNLGDLLPLITEKTYPRCSFCSDDRDCHTLLHDGHVDAIVRDAIAGGLDAVRAIRLVTWNPADYWRLDGLGAIAPGFEANLVVLSNLDEVVVERTLFQGRVVAEDGRMAVEIDPGSPPKFLCNSVNIALLNRDSFRLSPEHAKRAVVAVDGQIVTGIEPVEPVVMDGWAVAAPTQDLLKLVCVERHHATGRVGVGYIKGYGLQEGALASSIAHDAHNIVAVGATDDDLLLAIETIAEMRGGLAAVAGGKVLARLALPVAGIVSDRPLAEVAEQLEVLEATANSLGSPLISPFGLLAFLSLSVIPKARVTDHGFIVVD